MIEVQVVAPEHVYGIWDRVESFFEAAHKVGTDDCTVSQRKMLLTQGFEVLLVAVDGVEIVGALSIKTVNYPNVRAAFITALGGEGIVDEVVFKQVEHWASTQGATKIQFIASAAQARLYRQKIGCATDRYMMERIIQGVCDGR